MVISRIISLLVRATEFICAAVVLGLISWLIHLHEKGWYVPLAREIYIIIIASLSVIFSLLWMIPTTGHMLHLPFDLFLCVAWFAAFGVLVDYGNSINCGDWFYWGNIDFWGQWCGKWKAAEAFSFISACTWFVSFLLGILVYTKSRREPVAAEPVAAEPVAAEPTRRRRWGRSRV